MSAIKNDIERYMDGPFVTDTKLTSSFIFPSEFIGFQGHFPTNKVVPGACQIQCVLSTIEKALDKHVVLTEIMLAKYVAPVFPGDSLTCTVSEVPETGDSPVYKARISKGAEKISDLKLRVSIGDAL